MGKKIVNNETVKGTQLDMAPSFMQPQKENKLTLWYQEGNNEAKIKDINKGDRIITPDNQEYSISWNEQRKAIELVKCFSDKDGSITITPAVSNHIYIK